MSPSSFLISHRFGSGPLTSATDVPALSLSRRRLPGAQVVFAPSRALPLCADLCPVRGWLGAGVRRLTRAACFVRVFAAESPAGLRLLPERSISTRFPQPGRGLPAEVFSDPLVV